MHGIQVTVISFVHQAGGTSVGSVSGSASTQAQVTELVEAADAAARAAGPAEDANELVRDRDVARLGPRARPTPTSRLRHRRARARRGVRPRRAARAGCSTASSTTRSPRPTSAPSTGLRLRHVQPTGHWACTGKTTRPEPERLGRRGDPRLRRRRPAGVRRDAGPASRLGQAPLRPRGRPLRHDPAAERGRRRDGRRLLVRRGAGRLGGPVGLQPPSHRHPDRRGHHPPGGHALLRPGVPRPGVRPVRDGGVLVQRDARCSTTASAWTARTGSATAS